jgi:O-antigen polymerase
MQRLTGRIHQVLLAATLLLVSALFISPFATGSEFFGGLLGAKLLRIEQIALPLSFTLALLLLFNRRLTITKADIGVFLFLLWCAATEVFVHNRDTSLFLQQLYPYLLWGMIYIAFRLVSDYREFATTLVSVWILVTLVMAVMGLLQLYGRIPSNHNLFPTTGPFNNPGPFSGWIVAALPAALAILLATGSGGNEPMERRALMAGRFKIDVVTSPLWYARWFLLTLTFVTLFTVLLVLPPAGSRAAWLAAIAGFFYVVWYYPGRLKLRDDFRLWLSRLGRLKKILLALLLASVILAGGIGLYNLKRGSADGRVLIWKVTTGLIADRPLTGYGSEAFQRHYMSSQADWFEQGRGTPEQLVVAGSPQYPFNESLHIWLKKGVVGVILLSVILWFLLTAKCREKALMQEEESEGYSKRHEPALRSPDRAVLTGLKGTLVAMLVFAQFSYPMDISSFILQVVVVTALLAGKTAQVISVSGVKRLFLTVPLGMTITVGAVFMVPQRIDYYTATTRWKEAHRIYSTQSYDYSAALYSELYETLRHRGLFLQMYGKTLNMAGRYEESNELLREAEYYMSSQIISIAIGDNYRALGRTDDAAKAYLKAASMVPNMLYPRYQLAQMYVEAGMYEEATLTAREILKSTIKVETEASREIRARMEEIIMEHGEAIKK